MKNFHTQNIISIIVKLILFLSSYIPLILIIILQMLRLSLDNLKTPLSLSLHNTKTWNNIWNLKYIYPIFLLIVISIALIILLKIVLHCTKDPNLTTDIDIQEVNNMNSNYITNYFSVYIFPFITLNMTSLDGVGTVIILTVIIGYVYIKNDILYINPILNIIFKYNIYSIEIKENSKLIEIVLLSKKKRTELKINPNISAYRIGYNVFIEL